MIKFNYTQVENDFQSIYNLHEVLLSLALPKIASVATKTLSLEKLKILLSVPSEQASESTELFPCFDTSENFIKSLNTSFTHYANSF